MKYVETKNQEGHPVFIVFDTKTKIAFLVQRPDVTEVQFIGGGFFLTREPAVDLLKRLR